MSGSAPLPPRRNPESSDRGHGSYGSSGQGVFPGTQAPPLEQQQQQHLEHRDPPLRYPPDSAPPAPYPSYRVDDMQPAQLHFQQLRPQLPSQQQPQHHGYPLHPPQPPAPFSTPDRPPIREAPEFSSPKQQRKTKGHVASACVPCKRVHLRCDGQRPCSRCLTNGKEDTCVDVQHKKRDRPRLRDERESKYERVSPGYPPPEASIRRPLSFHEGQMVSGFGDPPLPSSGSYRVLKSQIGSMPRPITPRYIDWEDAQDAKIFGGSMPPTLRDVNPVDKASTDKKEEAEKILSFDEKEEGKEKKSHSHSSAENDEHGSYSIDTHAYHSQQDFIRQSTPSLFATGPSWASHTPLDPSISNYTDSLLPTFEARFDERDARENHRREKANQGIAALPIEEQPAAVQVEDELRKKFDADRELLSEAKRSEEGRKNEDLNRFGLELSSGAQKGLSVLYSPLPTSFENNGVSWIARNRSSSDPVKFGGSPPGSFRTAKDGRTSEALKSLHSSAFGDDARDRFNGIAASPPAASFGRRDIDSNLQHATHLSPLSPSGNSELSNSPRRPFLESPRTSRPPTPSQPNFEASTVRPGLSRRSSIDTIESLTFSAVSMSSASSIAGVYGGAESLFDFLSGQGWLQTLSREALQKVSLDEFELNLRRSLVQFSAHLKEEAASPTMVKAAGAVRRLARNAASLFCRSLESQPSCTGDIRAEDNDQIQDEEYEDNEDLLEDKEGGEDPKDLEFLLSKSVALGLLEENLQLFLHPDPVKRALFKIWPIAHLRESTLAIEYDLEWEVPNFLATYFSYGQELGKVLTVTGEATNAQAQSCRDYVAQTWPEIGIILLDSLQELLNFGSYGVSPTSAVVSFSMKLGSNHEAQSPTSHASVAVLASHDVQVQVASAISWICAAVRYSPDRKIVYSSILISAEKESTKTVPTISLGLAELEQIKTDQPCWHSLLPHAVIAKDFPIRYRAAGKGLEISFADMALLAQSMSFTEYGEGLIVEGLRTVLIPMGKIPADEAIQWHLEYKRQTKPPKKRSIIQVFEMVPIFAWYKSQNPKELFGMRCFLGWAEEAAVMIGTREFSMSKVYRSDAIPTPKTRRVKSHNISMGANCLGILGANGSKTWQTTSVPSNVTLEIDKDIHETLADDFNTSVLIYDTHEKTAWLLPQPSVVLYLTHKILARRKFPVFDGNRETEFKFAMPGPDGASEAFSILQQIIRFKVQKSPDFQDDLSNTVKQICFQLDLLGDRLTLATSEFELIGGSEGTNLYGFEPNEVVEMRSGIDIMQKQVDQPWTQMVRKRGMVLFCAGLGQPIVPKSPEKLCTTYRRVPPLRNLLATTGAVLHAYLEPYDQGPKGCRLDKRVEWIKDKTPIHSHTHGQCTPVFHEQSLRIVASATPDPSMLGSLSRYMSSGFIFTDNRSRTACYERPAPPQLTSPKQLPKEVIDNKGPSVSVLPADDSGSDMSLVDTDFGFNTEEMQMSSLSSDEFPQKESKPDQLVPSSLSVSISPMARPWNDSRQRDSIATDSPLRKQMSIASASSSGTTKTIKRKGRCTDLGISIDRGKKPISEKGQAAWHMPGRSLGHIPQKGIELPVRAGFINDCAFLEEMRTAGLGKRQVAEMEASVWNAGERSLKDREREATLPPAQLAGANSWAALEATENNDSESGRAKRRRYQEDR